MARVEPRTFSFEELIQQVQQGILRCPRFQRRFVWRGDQVLTFFDSIRQRYPVGSLLIWRTRGRYASFDRVGPVAVPPDQPKPPAEVGYVLDGHQRLSVIFGVFALTDKEAEKLRGPERVFLVYYDLETEAFVHSPHPKEHYLPARYLLGHDDELVAWLDNRRDVTEPGSSQRARWDNFRRRATQLQTTFAQYRLPYLDITDAELQEAVNIFWRVNSQGTTVRREEVFAALSWNPDGFDFAKAAKDLLDQHPRYQNFGTTPVLQSVLAALGEDIYGADWEEILKKHRTRLPDAMEDVRGALGRALEFLESQLGAASGRVVPYSVHIVLLTEFFRICPNPGLSTRHEIERWFWATSLASAYTSANDLRMNEAVGLFQRLARGESVSLVPERLFLRPFPRRFHPKSARVRAFHLFLKTRCPLDLGTGQPLDRTMLLRNGMADARLLTSGGNFSSWRLAGRLLLGPRRRPPLRELEAVAGRHAQSSILTSLGDEPDAGLILRSHLIPDDAASALLRGDLEAFLDLREREIIREERAFAKQYVELTEEEAEEEAEIDVEEEPESDL